MAGENAMDGEEGAKALVGDQFEAEELGLTITIGEMEIEDRVRGNLLIVSPQDPIQTAVERMAEDRSRVRTIVLVVNDGKLVGLLTGKDVARSIGQCRDLNAPCETVMTQKPSAIVEQEYVVQAIHVMTEEPYRHVPMVDEVGKPIGVVTARIIFSYWVGDHNVRSALKQIGLGSLSGKDPSNLWIDSGESIRAAASRMGMRRNSSALLVQGGDGRLSAVVTVVDLLRGIVEGIAPEEPVERIMSRQYRAVDLDGTLDDVVNEMANARCRHLPVRKERGEVAYLFSAHEVFQAIRDRCPEIAGSAPGIRLPYRVGEMHGG